jgi:hypothetical protein
MLHPFTDAHPAIAVVLVATGTVRGRETFKSPSFTRYGDDVEEWDFIEPLAAVT